MGLIWLVFAEVLYQVLTSKKLILLLANQSCLSKLYFELWDNKESSKGNWVLIYKIMYTEHCENTSKIELSSVSTKNHLIDFGVCALAGCTNFIILHNYFKKIFYVHFWVFKFDAT